MSKTKYPRQESYDYLLESIVRAQRQHANRGRKGRLPVNLYWQIGRSLTRIEEGAPEHWQPLCQAIADQLELPLKHLRLFMQFFRAFPEVESLRSGLSWTHFQVLLQLEPADVRQFYFAETERNHWSTRELRRQIAARYYERCQTIQKTGRPEGDFLKDLYILEFLDADLPSGFEERELETALLNKLQTFLLELGKGFAFVARQKRIFTESGRHFYIDLVFYHFILKCFVLIDLKTGALAHQDIGQMDMYVRLYEDKWRGPQDQPTLGLILCAEKDHTIVKYSMLHESSQLFASRYQLYLPTEEELNGVIGTGSSVRL